MKKILFMMMFALVTASSFAQEKHPYYCTISGTYNLAMKIRLELDWCEQKHHVALLNEVGKLIEFNNLTYIVCFLHLLWFVFFGGWCVLFFVFSCLRGFLSQFRHLVGKDNRRIFAVLVRSHALANK